MNVIETALYTDLSVRLIKGMFRKGYDWMKGDATPYQQELVRIIGDTITLYEAAHPRPENENILFYQSAALFEELLRYRLDIPVQPEYLKRTIDEDERIVVPSEKEITEFLALFEGQVQQSSLLEQLHIQNNYKETTFHNALKLDYIAEKITLATNEIIDTIKTLDLSKALAAEWQKEVKQIREQLHLFKPFTAMQLITNLEERISAHEIRNKELEAQILYLKGSAMEDQEPLGQLKKSAALFVQCYNMFPQNKTYQQHAALSYVVLGELDKAEQLADIILSEDEYNFIAWSAKLYKQTDLAAFVNNAPGPIQKTRGFQLNAFFCYLKNENTARLVHLQDSPLAMTFEKKELDGISYHNYRFWLFVSEYIFSKLYYEFPLISNYAKSDELKSSPLFQLYVDILDKVINLTKDGEVNELMAVFRFKFHYAELILTGDLQHITWMESLYPKIDYKNHVIVMHMVQAYNLLENKESWEKIICIIDEFGHSEHELLALFKCDTLLRLGKTDEAIQGYAAFMKEIDVISLTHVNNLIQFFMLCISHKVTDKAVPFSTWLMDNGNFPNTSSKVLLGIFIDSFIKKQPIDTEFLDRVLTDAEAGLDPGYPEIEEFYIRVLRNLQQFERLIIFLRPRITYRPNDRNLQTFAEALYNSNGNKKELLQVLRKARKELSPDLFLLRIEMRLRETQREWKKLLTLAETAIEHFPKDGYAINMFFLASSRELAVEKIIAKKDLVKDHKFESEFGPLTIYYAFLQAGLHTEAAEILYTAAQDKRNLQARQTYLSAPIRLPAGIFLSYPTAIPGSHVEYKIDGQLAYTVINAGDPATISFRDKKVGETFNYFNEFTSEVMEVVVTNITNKYAAFHQQLVKEAANPLSGLQLKELKNEDAELETVKRNMMREFGAIGEMGKAMMMEHFEQYQNGQISFTEITKGNFRNDPFDAYTILTQLKGAFFHTIPLHVTNPKIDADTTIVLDATTVMLLFELEKEKPIIHHRKFLISNFVANRLKELIFEAGMDNRPELTVSISTRDIVPHRYSPNFWEEKKLRLMHIQDWIEKNCETDPVDEKLDLVIGHERTENDDYINYMLDNKLMAERDNHLLITSDAIFFRLLANSRIQMAGPLTYLRAAFPGESFSAYLIGKNYTGIEVTKDDLSKEFTAFLAGQDNHYLVAVENLKVNRTNGNIRNVEEGILFLKWLYLQPIVVNDVRFRNAEYILAALASGLHPRGHLYLLAVINKQFALLPIALSEVLDILKRVTGN